MSLLFIQWHRQFFVRFPSFIYHTFLSNFTLLPYCDILFACGTCFFMEAVAKYFHTILCFRVLTFALINQFTHYCSRAGSDVRSSNHTWLCDTHRICLCQLHIINGLKSQQKQCITAGDFFEFKVYFRLLDKKCPSQMSVILLVPFIPLSWVNVLGKIGWTEICFLLWYSQLLSFSVFIVQMKTTPMFMAFLLIPFTTLVLSSIRMNEHYSWME